MDKLSPKEPVRADHRFIMKLCAIMLSGKVEYRPSEFNRVARVFNKLGGSWESLFKGSPSEISRLRKVIKTAAKNGYLTKKESWDGKIESPSGQESS